MYTNSQIKFKSLMLKLRLCDYSDAYILVKGTIANTRQSADDKRNKGVMFKNCSQFSDCMNEISNTQINNAKDLDVLMLVHNLIEYSDNFLKTSGSLYRDKPA